jgi:hypothetical protein
VRKRSIWKRDTVQRGRDAEESPLLEVVTRKWLLKIQQTGKNLAGAVVICESWRLAMML